jgi:hypothetical protein
VSATESPWEEFLSRKLFGYLLPASAATSLPEDEARRFLSRLTGRPHQLDLLREASVLAPRGGAFAEFAGELLPSLVRALPSQNAIVTREWEGGFHGKLDVRRTLSEWLGGARSRFVTSSRRRDVSLPETVLVRAVAVRLLAILTDLRQAGALSEAGWGSGYIAWEPVLRRLVGTSGLRDVAAEQITARHLEAAGRARHPCYRAALGWWRDLSDGLDGHDPARIARVVARGALAPLSLDRQFELAVAVRLVEALTERLCGDSAWRLELCLMRAGREEIAALVGPSGARVRVFHDQAWLDAGPADLGAQYYLAQCGRLRPDVTVIVDVPGAAPRAHVIEVKRSDDPGYLRTGFNEAVLYANEYRTELTGWPKAMLVASSAIPGAVRRSDDVIAVAWNRWVPSEVVDGLVAGL